MLPSTSSTYRPLQTASGVRGRSVASQLRLFLCGCGLLYGLLLWHSGPWTTWTATTPTAARAATKSAASLALHQRVAAEPPKPRVLAGQRGHDAHPLTLAPPEYQSEPPTPRSQPETPRSAPLPLSPLRTNVDEASNQPSAAATAAPFPSTATPTTTAAALPSSPSATTPTSLRTTTPTSPSATTPTSPSATTPTSPSTTTPMSAPATTPTSAPPLIDADWLRSLLLMQQHAPRSPSPLATLSYETHSARMHELETRRSALAETLARLKTRLTDVHAQLEIHAAVLADDDAKRVLELPRAYKRQREQRSFRCLGWRATADCDPNGRRVPANDRSCEQSVPATQAGYCELEDTATKERFRVAKTSCDTLRWDAALRCVDASDFPNFAIQADEMLRNATLEQARELVPSDEQQTRGIVVVVYPKLLPSAYATLRTLRRQGCSLPVELWYKPSELEDAARNPIVSDMVEHHGPVTLRAIHDESVKGFTTKIHAIEHSSFAHVLFLDADNVPVRDPTYLFDLPEYTSTGALFWPDFWHPNHTIFALHNRSLVWEYIDLDYVDMFEQESGQLVVDKTRSQRAFALLHFYAHHQPNLLDSFKIVHGDKDLFRFAWIKSNSSFHMVDRPPAVAGSVAGDVFCGQTMAQFDPNGELIFLHRNAKKLQGRHVKYKPTLVPGEALAADGEEEVDPEIWTHLLQLKPTSTRADYTIDIYEGSELFPKGQWCYGKKSPATPHFNTFRFADLPARGIENEIRAYAIEATDLLRASEATAPQTSTS